jgi:hypothetical protein
MEKYFKYFAYSVIGIYLLVMITLHQYPSLRAAIWDSSEWIANIINFFIALGTFIAAIIAYSTYKSNVKLSNSKDSLEQYTKAIDSYIASLCNDKLPNSHKLHQAPIILKLLRANSGNITNDTHRVIAKEKLSELNNHIVLFFERDITVSDFFKLDSSKQDKFPDSGSNLTQRCASLLIDCWFSEITPKISEPLFDHSEDGSEINNIIYGYEGCIEKGNFEALYALLVSKTIKIEPYEELVDFRNSTLTQRRLPLIPKLYAHLLLCDSLVSVDIKSDESRRLSFYTYNDSLWLYSESNRKYQQTFGIKIPESARTEAKTPRKRKGKDVPVTFYI